MTWLLEFSRTAVLFLKALLGIVCELHCCSKCSSGRVKLKMYIFKRKTSWSGTYATNPTNNVMYWTNSCTISTMRRNTFDLLFSFNNLQNFSLPEEESIIQTVKFFLECPGKLFTAASTAVIFIRTGGIPYYEIKETENKDRFWFFYPFFLEYASPTTSQQYQRCVLKSRSSLKVFTWFIEGEVVVL